jgi:hypothetical protein
MPLLLFIVLRGLLAGVSAFDPCVNFVSLKLPQLAYSMGWKIFFINPSIDGVFSDAKILGDFIRLQVAGGEC